MQQHIDDINNLTNLYDESLRARALQWLDRYTDASITRTCTTEDGCICIEYNLDDLYHQCVVFETKRLIMWNTVGNVRKNYRRVQYLT
jgi:hypothetical protein